MPSGIDPTKPVTGVPASKADLRANLQATKTELEHGGFFTQAATGAVTRTVQAKLREYVSVKDFGAVGNGSADDSNAIEAAIDSVGQATGWNGLKTIFFPKGDYRVTRNVFSRTPSNSTGQAPVVFKGEHGLTSVVLLDPPTAAETWLYDNVSTSRRYFCEWHNMGFRGMGTNAAFASGFRFWSSGHEQGFKFFNCYMGQDGGLRRAILLAGAANASEILLSGCHIRDIGVAVLTWDNAQALNVDFIATNVEGVDGDIFVVASGGGGDLRVIGGSYIWGTDANSMKYLLNITGGFNLTHRFDFYGIRCEQHDAMAGLVRKTSVDGKAGISFSGCDFQGVSGDGAFEGVTIAARCDLTFENCWLQPKMTYRLTNTNEALENNGTIRFRSCRVPDELKAKITIDRYGYASARDCALMQGVGAHHPQDFELGWQNMMYQGYDVHIKRVVIKTQLYAWPVSTTTNGAASAASLDRVVVLPVNSIITGFRIHKPAAGSGTNQYQLHVGPNNRSTAWASSTLTQHNAAHTINVQLSPANWINVGTDPNLRAVTLWANPGGTVAAGGSPNLAGSIAFVEYI